MKVFYLLLALVSLLAVSVGKAIPSVSPVALTAGLLRSVVEKGLVPHNAHRARLNTRAVDVQTEWSKALCKGIRLTQAMIVSEEKAAEFVTPVRSQWSGDLVEEFKTWGYREMPGSRDNKCDFGPDMHDLERAFKAMGIDSRSSGDGGQNVCYHIEHLYGPAVIRKPDGGWPDPDDQVYKVNGKEYKETQAYSTIGINSASGVLYFIHRLSPYEAAKLEWDVADPKREDLPALRTTSDHAWGFWNRANKGNLGNLKKIMSTMIMNDITQALISNALATYQLAPGEQRPTRVMPWPGTTFDSTTDQGDALIGSPNGLAAGYFLVQHKRELGRKYIEKVTVFRADKGGIANLLFWVADVPDTDSEGEDEDEEHDPSACVAELQGGFANAEVTGRGLSLYERNDVGDYVIHIGHAR